METKLFALILMSVLMLLSLVPAVHAETWTKHDIDTTAWGPRYLVIHDIDNDGNPDVVVANDYYDRISWYEAPDDPTGEWTEHVINVTGGLDGANGVFVHDMDNDTDPDVVATGYLANVVVWYECNASDPTGNWNNYTIGSANGAWSVYVYDINNDTRPDVVASAHGPEGKVVWFEAPDDPKTDWPSTNKHVIGSLPVARGIYVADMDNDTDPDVVAASDGTYDDVVWFECPDTIADRTGTWSSYIIDDSLNDAVNVDVADIDGDGNPDVVATGRLADEVVWYEAPDNPNQTSWIRRVIGSSLNGAWGVHIYNIDGWSTLDVVATAVEGDEVVWYQGPEDIQTDPGATWVKNTIKSGADADGAFGVDVYDIDGNLTYQGEPDVVVGLKFNDVVWYKSDWSGLWPIPEVPLGTILLLGTGLLIPVTIAAAKRLRLNHRLRK